MKHALLLTATTCSALCSSSQDLLWLNAHPVDWNMNYAMVNHQVDASPGGLLGGVRQFGPGMSFGIDVFNDLAVDWIDPTTGIPFSGCSMTDSVLMESMVTADDGTIYVAGRFMGDIQFCDGSTLEGTGGFLDTDLFLAAFSSSTSGVAWMRNLSVEHPEGQRVPALAIDANGTLWYGYEAFDEFHLISVDALGADDEEILIMGTRVLGGFGFDAWNNLYVSGSTGDSNGPLVFGGLSVPMPDAYDIFILRMRADGTGHWAKLAEAGTFHGPDVAVDPNGDAFVSTEIMMATNWGGLSFNGPNWVGDVILAKVDSVGDFQWGKESAPAGMPITGDMRQSRMTSIDSDASGTVYLTGTARGQTQWGNGVVSDAITLGAYAQTVVAFNSAGNAQWALTSNPSSLNAQAVSCADDGTVYFTGHVLGPYSIGGMIQNSGGLQAFVDGRIDGLNTGLLDGSSAGALSAWPVPASDHIQLHSASARGSFMLLSAAGQLAASGALRPGMNTVDISTLAAGIYMLRTATGESIRMVKQ